MLVVWLWFDVEVRYNTTLLNREIFLRELWFDVEVRYNTTWKRKVRGNFSCGLM